MEEQESSPVSPPECVLEDYEEERCVSPVTEFYPVEDIPETPRTIGPLLIPICTLNPYITCGICLGYLYEATTITECMHTFCKSCFVKHTEKSVHCPICNLLIHPTDPFVNVKLDRTLQDIVYRLLPHVAEEELRREDIFNEEHKYETKEVLPQEESPEERTDEEVECCQFTSPVSLILESGGGSSGIAAKPLNKKFVRVTGGATIGTVASFLKKKLSVEEKVNVELYCACGSGSICLDGTHTLQAVKELYCQQQQFLQLQYHIRPI